jgi:hypothetical protein
MECEGLGMGREIGRRLDEVNSKGLEAGESVDRDETSHIIGDGLDQLRQQMAELVREHRRSSAVSTKSMVDYQEIYNAMRAALKDSAKGQESELQREDVIEAVRNAWEEYKPDIHVEQLGLEREEILACLKEGLQDYISRDQTQGGANRDEVFDAVVEGLKHFNPPQMDTPVSLSRDEILAAVRECLEEFEFPVAPAAIGAEMSKSDMLAAVQEGLNSFDFPASQAVVTAGSDSPEILGRLQDIMEFIQAEFRAVSEEAKQNVAANGRDTEQVLDATRDGFDELRIHMEGYINQAAGANDREEYLATLVRSLDEFRDEISGLVARANDGSQAMLKTEVESLRDAVNSSLVPHSSTNTDHGQRDMLQALKDGMDKIRTELLRPHAGTTDILDALHEGFTDLHAKVGKLGDKPVDLTANDEILDALKCGLSGVRSDIETLKEHTQNDKAVAPISDKAIIPADILKQDDIKNVEVLLTQLRIKVEAMETTQPDIASETTVKLTHLEEVLESVQESIAGLSSKQTRESHVNPDDNATKEDVQAIETILRNTKAALDEIIEGEQAVRKDHIDAIEALVLESKDSLSTMAAVLEAVSRKEDVNVIESLVTQITSGLDEMKERAEKALEDPERVTKTDVDAVEAVCLDLKSMVEQMVKADIASLPSKEDFTKLETLVTEFKERAETHAETNTKAFEERQAETVGVSERVTEVKTFLEDLQAMIKEKLESGATGAEALGKTLETVSENVEKNATASTELKELLESMKAELKVELEDSKAGVVGANLETTEKLQQNTEVLTTKIDEKIGELILKYDDFQTVMEEKTKVGEARDVELEAAVLGTKSVADELKTLIDTLGSTVTDSLEKMEEASKTVFDRVDVLYGKSEENHSDHKNEHQTTRDHVKQAITAVEGLQGHVIEYEPKILEAVKDVLLIVGEHYEHSKTTTTDIEKKIEESKPEPPLLPPPPEKYDDSEVHLKLDKLMTQDSEGQTKLDQLVSQGSGADSKLDKLVDHAHAADKAFTQLDTLDKVHKQVLLTASELSEFLANQKQRIEDEQINVIHTNAIKSAYKLQVSGVKEFNAVIFKDKASAPAARKFFSLFPGLGYAAGYKVRP